MSWAPDGWVVRSPFTSSLPATRSGSSIRLRAAVERARERGCRVADTVEAMWLTDPTAVLLSLATEDAFRDVVEAILRARRDADAADAVVIDTSTLPLTAKEQAAVRLADVGTELLDCPVSGTGSTGTDTGPRRVRVGRCDSRDPVPARARGDLDSRPPTR